jgi:hypothetical protein
MIELVGLLLVLAVPLGYVALQLRALVSWHGPARLAALLPLLGWTVWGVSFARDVARDPTSHNLFPVEILLGAGAALVYLGLVMVLRRLLSA